MQDRERVEQPSEGVWDVHGVRTFQNEQDTGKEAAPAEGEPQPEFEQCCEWTCVQSGSRGSVSCPCASKGV